MSRPFTLKKNNAVAIFLLCALTLAGAYANFSYRAQQLNGQLFDVAETLSWRQAEGNLFRIHAQGSIENILLTKRSWGTFRFSTVIYNPRDCGFLFAHQPNGQFHFIIFDAAHAQVLWGINKGGRFTILKKGRFEFPSVLQAELRVSGLKAELFLNRSLHSFLDLPVKSGKAGVMNNAVRSPPTVFSDITFEDNAGIYRNAGILIPQDSSFIPKQLYYVSVALLLAVLAGFTVFILLFLDLYKNERENFYAGLLSSLQRSWVVSCIHLAAAVFVFWPFISRGHILASSSDNLGQIYPLFIYSAQIFKGFFQGQEFALWNPYVHNGVPFFSNHWNMVYYPLNWPLFFLPQEWMLIGVTARCFLETWLIGLLAYKLFRQEFRDAPWALFSSVAYQLCSILIFGFTIFPTSSMMFALTLYLYLLWSWNTRKPFGNFVYLTVSVVLLLTGANLAFVLYGCMVLIVMTAYRLASLWRERVPDARPLLITVGASLAAGFLIAAVRIIPCIIGVLDSNRLAESFYTIHDRFALVVRLFIPEIVGWLGTNFFNALMSPNLHLIFRDINLPSNAQNAFFVYFGVASGLLLLLGIIIPAGERARFWKIYALISLALGLMLQPFWGFFNILLYPFNHYSYYIVIIPAGLCMFLGCIGSSLEKRREEIKHKLPMLVLVVVLLQVYIVVFVTYLFPMLAKAAQGVLFILSVFGIVYTVYGKADRYSASLVMVSVGLTLIVASVLGLLGASTAFFAPIVKKQAASAFIIVPALMIFLLIASVLGLKLFLSLQKKERHGMTFLFAVFAAIFIVLMVSFEKFSVWIRTAPVPERNYFVDVALGEAKFLFIALIFLTALALYARSKLSSPALWGILFVVLILDLLGFNARFDNVVAPTPVQKAFYPVKYPYGDIDPTVRRQIDLVNYRADELHRAGLQANENMLLKIPSYSGIVGHMPKRFSNFIVNFGYPQETVLIYPEESSADERFLDLCAVKYKFTSPVQLEMRSSALARLNLLAGYEVVASEEQTLSLLKDQNFDPRFTVLLAKDIFAGDPVPGAKGPATAVALVQESPNEVSAQVQNRWPHPAALLFVETFAPGWKAFVDNEPVDVVAANHSFMAIRVPSGVHDVRFVYRPPIFYLAGTVSAISLAVFLLLSFGFWVNGVRR